MLWLIDNINKFCPLSSYVKIGRGERRGWDKLFYPTSEDLKKIENEYLKPVLKTAKGKFEYILEPDSQAFCCDKSIDELMKSNHTGALSWIRSFEGQSNTKGKSLVESLKRAKSLWYQMNAESLADFVLTMNPDTRIFFQRMKCPTFVNQRLISISVLESKINKDFLHSLLNSTITLIQIEGIGFGRGLGVLDINPTNVKKGLYLPKVELFSDESKEEIVECFNNMTKKSIQSIDKEILREDRNLLDRLILKNIGLSENLASDIQKSFLSLYRIRKSVKS